MAIEVDTERLVEESGFEARDDFGNFDSNILFLEKTAQLQKECRILEIGCGTGRLLSHLHTEGYTIKGVDVNPGFLSQGRELHGKLPVITIDSEQLPFRDNSFDIVLGFDVFEHIQDTDGHLNEVSRVLKDGGCYLLQTPNKWTNVIFETIRWKSLSSWRDEHCSLHSYFELKKSLDSHSFSVEFYNIPIMTDFFIGKVRRYMGNIGVFILKIVNIDRFPYFMRTNFYVKAVKRSGN